MLSLKAGLLFRELPVCDFSVSRCSIDRFFFSSHGNHLLHCLLKNKALSAFLLLLTALSLRLSGNLTHPFYLRTTRLLLPFCPISLPELPPYLLFFLSFFSVVECNIITKLYFCQYNFEKFFIELRSKCVNCIYCLYNLSNFSAAACFHGLFSPSEPCAH